MNMPEKAHTPPPGRGKQTALIGTAMVVSSNLLLYALVFFQIYIGFSAFVFIGCFDTLGFIMLFAAMVKENFRARWLFIFLFLYGGLLLSRPPVGTVLGLTAYFYILKNWRSFFTEESRARGLTMMRNLSIKIGLRGSDVSSKSRVVWGLIGGLCTALLWVLSMPPFEFAEAAYIAFAPLLLWLYGGQSKRLVAGIGLLTGWLAWLAILIWLRHVTLVGTALLSALLGAIFSIWLLVANSILPRLKERGLGWRLCAFCGLAGAWVLLEWMRGWLFWGFPWAPMALSQWERPVILQVASWTGAYGVSFLLLFFNLAVASTLRLKFVQRERKLWTGWFSADLYLALALLGLCISLFFRVLPAPDSAERLFTAAVVQPYIPPSLKWDETREAENLAILERQTQFVGSLESDLILWPEAATPWAIVGYPQMEAWVQVLAQEVERPILMGNLAWDRDADLWYNGVFLMDPAAGLAEEFYAKRELVPFGEFVPPLFRFIDKVVPVGGDFAHGEAANLLELTINGRVLKVGSLVCYEDVFPRLARASAAAGADFFFVATNNAWYGEEGGAEQHAAHSVLRAVENRRPVIRAGNGGWSGWIDAYGTVREVLTDENGSIFFRGGGSLTVLQFREWSNQVSFYTRHGDWFVALCGAFTGLSWLLFCNGFKRHSP